MQMETRSSHTGNFTAVPRGELEYAWDHRTTLDSDESVDDATEGEPSAPPSRSYTSLPPLFRLAQFGPVAKIGENASQGDDADAVKMEEDVEESAAAASIKAESSAAAPSIKTESSAAAQDPLTSAQQTSEMTVTVLMTSSSQFAEAKWLKTGDVEDWLSTLPGFASRAQDQAWRGKIHVVDPDPPPTIQDVFSDWAVKSFMGSGKDRRRFIADHLQTAQGQMEIFCRLVRGERASSVALRELGSGNPLAEAAGKTAFASHQTHLSLAVMALFGVAEEYARAAGDTASVSTEVKVEGEGEAGNGKSTATSATAPTPFEAKISEILMSMPQNLLFKALDGLVSALCRITHAISISLIDPTRTQWKEVMEKNQRNSRGYHIPTTPSRNAARSGGGGYSSGSGAGSGGGGKRKASATTSTGITGNKKSKRERSRSRSQSVARSVQGAE